MILNNTINQAAKLLKKHNISSHLLDAEIILSEVMGVSREFLLTNDQVTINKKQVDKYYKAIKRRIKNEPVAYIIGKKEFWKESFTVNNSTLVPRPETELLIYKIIKIFKEKNINILDIGTGTGCILLSILKELKFSTGTGIDISKKTLKVAIKNSKKLNLQNRAKFKVFSINDFCFGKYDLVVSNPPYIISRDLKSLSKDIVQYEPLIALNGGHDGLDLIREVIYKSKVLLKKNGLLAIEIGNQQYRKVSVILRKNGFREIHKEHDNRRNIRCIMSTKL